MNRVLSTQGINPSYAYPRHGPPQAASYSCACLLFGTRQRCTIDPHITISGCYSVKATYSRSITKDGTVSKQIYNKRGDGIKQGRNYIIKCFIMSSMAAETQLLKPGFIGQASFDKYRVDTLRNLCQKFDLGVTCSGKRGKPIKHDYIAALHEWVKSCSTRSVV